MKHVVKYKIWYFKKGNVSGNVNYTVGICVGDKMVRVLHMLDSHGCLSAVGIYPDQLELVRKNTELINERQNKKIPGFIGLHFPTDEYRDAQVSKGYATNERTSYVIGVKLKLEMMILDLNSKNSRK